ncbi:MAG: cystathionine beta-lyase [Deltaproteobacteria bacterium]|nr:cystathionine beta-lyase [Deltaproteobacteria bacterium]
MKEESRIIQRGWLADSRKMKLPTTVNPPVYQGSTVLFDNFDQMCRAGQGDYDGPTYGTDRLVVQRILEQALRELEGGFATRVCPSGLSAIQTTLNAFLKSGDHLLVVDNAYGPGLRYCKKVLSKFNIETSVIPPSIGAEIVAAIRPETALILLESPGSHTFEIQDIRAITAVAREKNIVTALDNTWATPLYLKPLALGVDVSIQSVTKYIAGYSDVLMGAVTVNERYGKTFTDFYSLLEIYTPDRDCYLALRGLNTLGVRLRQHETSALRVAAWLQGCEKVGTVIHPALPSHPEHHLFKRDFKGSSGLFGFTFAREYSHEELARFADSLEFFGLGYSWGGYKSLLTAAKQQRETPSRYAGQTIVRLHIGLENPEDLIADLSRAMETLP